MNDVDDRLAKKIDRQYLATPFYGSRRMAEFLQRNHELVNRKRVQHLMRIIGIEGRCPVFKDLPAKIQTKILEHQLVIRPGH